MNFAKDLEMPEETREKVNRVLRKQRDKIALREQQLEDLSKKSVTTL